MKTSKLLLLTFIGLVLSVMTVTIDLLDRDSFISADQLPTAAKTYLHKYFPNGNVAYSNIKNDIIKATYEVGASNSYELGIGYDDMLLDMDY